MIAIDASVLAPALGDDGDDGAVARARMRGERIVAPEVVMLEVASVWRRLVRAGTMTPARASRAVTDLRVIPVQRVAHRALLDRCWELRENLTIYDAAYVAVAERFGVTLLTADRRLANAAGVRCAVEVLVS